MFLNKVINELNTRKDILGMSNAVIAERSGVSEPTIVRILSGKHNSASFEYVCSIAEALGLNLLARDAKKVADMKREQAEKKAKFIMSMVSGNSALESVTIGARQKEIMFAKTVDKLLKGSNRDLWAA